MKTKYLIFCFCLIIYSFLTPVFAKPGRIISVQDNAGHPIAKATFFNKTKNYTLLFNSEGKLQFDKQPLDKNDHILITCVGYKHKSITGRAILNDKELIITLDVDLVALNEVIVKNTPVSLSFKNVKSLPFPMVYNACVADSLYAYTISGFSGRSMLTQALKYDPHANEWSELANGLTPRVQATACYVPATQKIYVIGGITSWLHFIYADNIEAIDVKTGKAEILPVKNPMPTAYGGSAVWENKIYLFGGATGANDERSGGNIGSGTFYEFDPSTLTFTKLPNMPQEQQTAGTIVDGILYTFGGYEPQYRTPNKNIYAYDIKNRLWKLIGKLPRNVSANGVAACGHLIFVAGGYEDNAFTGFLNTRTNKFTQIKSDVIGRRHANAVVLSNHLMIIGGGGVLSVYGMSNVQAVDLKDVLAAEE
ncbi:MAG: hypothetical protein JWR38_5562 [Mucilaginibacter sp.]|nr:hypothetical protein [Mucilaginibacter sp.]